jgi:hypothetical protein
MAAMDDAAAQTREVEAEADGILLLSLKPLADVSSAGYNFVQPCQTTPVG